MKDILYQALAAWGQSLGPEGVRRWGERLGRLLWRAIPSRRDLAAEAMALHLDLPADKAREMAERNFLNTGRSFLEMFLTRRIDRRFVREHLRIENPELFKDFKAMAGQRPVVVATGHLGAWELLSPVSEVMFPDWNTQIVVRKPKDEALNKVMTHLRAQPSVQVVEHRQATLKVLRHLKKNGCTAFLVDHNCSTSEAVFLPFLKRIAAVNMGPALLAVRAGAVIQPMVLIREGEGYLLHLESGLDTATLQGPRDQRIARAALFYTQVMERAVRRWPEQWYWMHRRWKTQPPEGWVYTPPED
ncbi:lysophospholipid acyltransferase family protein [Desulfocurvus sp. DL9XJH121]